MVIKAVVFDVGDVLVRESGSGARDILAKKYGFSREDFRDYVVKNLDKSYCGKLDSKDFFGGLISKLGLKGVNSLDMVKDWIKVREEKSFINEDVLDVVRKLKGNYVLGILSNSTFLNEQVSYRRKCYENFDFKILSCDFGANKPDRKIYDILVCELGNRGVKPEETVYVDDKEKNLLPAKRIGIETILFKDARRLVLDLKKLGVRV